MSATLPVTGNPQPDGPFAPKGRETPYADPPAAVEPLSRGLSAGKVRQCGAPRIFLARMGTLPAAAKSKITAR